MEITLPQLFMGLNAVLAIGLLLYFTRRPKKVTHFKPKEASPENVIPISEPHKQAQSLLSVSNYATKEDILKAYRKKIRQFHPDTVAHRGEEFIKWAREHTIQIQKAKELLLNQKEVTRETTINQTKRQKRASY